MSKQKYWRLVVNYKDASPDEEDWIEDLWLSFSPEETIRRFNHALNPGERERILIGALPLKDNLKRPHSWIKTSLVTEQNRVGFPYDAYKCERCGVTGKRFRLESQITLDSKYKAAKYKFCII